MDFKLGEICFGCGLIVDTHKNGMDCEIIRTAFYKKRRRNSVTGDKYPPAFVCRVKWADGSIADVEVGKLRRKPPKSDLLSWAKEKVADLLITRPNLVKEPA